MCYTLYGTGTEPRTRNGLILLLVQAKAPVGMRHLSNRHKPYIRHLTVSQCSSRISRSCAFFDLLSLLFRPDPSPETDGHNTANSNLERLEDNRRYL
jgi:hypothetical protein